MDTQLHDVWQALQHILEELREIKAILREQSPTETGIYP